MSAFDPKRTCGSRPRGIAHDKAGFLLDMSGLGLLLCKLTPEPHFVSRKSLM
jgi:hypothetical protein